MINVRHTETGLEGRVVRLQVVDNNVLVHIDSKHIQIRGVYAIHNYLAHFQAEGISDERPRKQLATPDWRLLYV